MRGILAALALAALLLPVAAPATALAHERRDVGKYQLVVGWYVEPAFVGEKNGLDLRVTNAETGQPVEGLEKTMRAEVIYGGQRREFELRAVFGAPGRYTADIVPTREGDYRFRFFGTIEGLQVNETFDSADGKFNSVKAPQSVHFPEVVPAAGDIARTATAADQKATLAQHTAATTQAIGVAGAILGALGVLLGGMALVSSSRQARMASGAVSGTPPLGRERQA